MDQIKPAYWIDTHIHLAAPEYEADLAEVLSRNKKHNITKVIAIGSGYGLAGIQKTIALGKEYEQIWTSIGIHPNEASEPWSEQEISDLACSAKAIAIGETGLDYYHTMASKQDQKRAFEFQIQLARSIKKPLIIHNREAGEDCLHILQQQKAHEVGGVFHCYSEDADFAKKLKDLNFNISITGNITYKKNEALRAAVSKIPLEQILLETDGPYLSPQSKRGKRNESSYMLETAETIAKLKDIDLWQLAEATNKNAETLFKI